MRIRKNNILFFIACSLCWSLFSAFKPKSQTQTFDVNQPNYELLNSLIINYINDKRSEKQKQNLQENEALQKTAFYFTHQLRLKRIERMMDERRVLKRKVYLQSWKNGFQSSLVEVSITFNKAVNYEGGSFYFDGKDTETTAHLFYGKRPSKKEKADNDFKLKPIKDYTYSELAELIAENFLRDNRSIKVLNKGYSLIGCSTSLEKNTVNRNRLPLIKAVFILGGKRITW
jgi:hypothetical protein